MKNQQQTIGKNKSSGEEKVERLATEKAETAEKSQAKNATEKSAGKGAGKGAEKAVEKHAAAGGKKKTAATQAKKGDEKSKQDKKQSEKAAAKKRVELALKKEERKAEKQKAKAERKKKRAEAKEKRIEKRLAAKEERRKKRLEHRGKHRERAIELKEKRAAAKAARKEKQAERKAQKQKRRAMIKSETKEARAKRLEKEKAAKIAAKKEKRARRYQLRLQRRDAALKRKQRRLESKERRRSENHAPGFGGWLAAVISLGVVTLALGTVVTVGAVRMNQANGALSTGYRGALFELTGTLSDVDGDLAKARVASGKQSQSELLTDLLVKTRIAESNLEKFPVDSETDVNMTLFLNRAGDAAQAMLQKIRSGGSLSAEDYSKLDELYAVNQKILNELSALSGELTDKDMAAFMKDKAGNKVYERFRNIENYAAESGYSTENEGGISATNGNKSDKSTDGTVSEKSGENVSSAQAEEACRRYFADYNIASIEYAGETVSGNIDAFNYTMTDDQGRRLYAEISKNNAALVGFDYFADCSAHNFDLENALTIAQNYLDFLGYDNMTAAWVSESGVNATFLFVYEENGVAYYPDSVSVKVCEERGKVVGFTAVSFLKNHQDRSARSVNGEKNAQSAVSREKAESALSPRLTVQSARKAVIGIGDNETLCYEFACNYGEDGYFVYVDAQTGEEIRITRILSTTHGRYLR
ncbi:MAG: germination protein YpeB [Candidatus Borkfalkiaceae bacterium]|nr:germination protein YpeB [Clostridia bacterium]MDY6223206.1 germination protein YpeB [Christensenellaceae bacterium]